MYESFYHLRQRPFAAAADVSFVVETPAAADAITRLERCVRQARGVAAVTGAAGMGKTLLLHGLAGRLDHDFGVIFVPNGSFAGPRGLLQFLLAEIGETYEQLGETEMRLRLTAAAAEARATTGGVVLLLDEAHRYTERLLEEARLLANHIDAGEPLFRIVLAGQLALEDQLAEGDANGLSERIGEVVTLPRLTTNESRNYLSSRVEIASDNGPDNAEFPRNCIANPSETEDYGTSDTAGREQSTTLETLFEPEAIDVLTQACGGIPRCLNQLADHALLLGFVAERATVSESLVREALEDLKRLPLQWHDPRPAKSLPTLEEIEASFDDIAPASESFDQVVEIGTLDDDDESGDLSPAAESRDEIDETIEDASLAKADAQPPPVSNVSENAAADDYYSAETTIPPAVPPPPLEPVCDRFARLDADLAEQRWLADWDEALKSEETSLQRSPVPEEVRLQRQSDHNQELAPGAVDDTTERSSPSPEKVFRVTPDSSAQSDVHGNPDRGWEDCDQPALVKKSAGNSATLFRDLRRRQG